DARLGRAVTPAIAAPIVAELVGRAWKARRRHQLEVADLRSHSDFSVDARLGVNTPMHPIQRPFCGEVHNAASGNGSEPAGQLHALSDRAAQEQNQHRRQPPHKLSRSHSILFMPRGRRPAHLDRRAGWWLTPWKSTHTAQRWTSMPE